MSKHRHIDFLEIEGRGAGFYLLLGALGALVLAALGSAYYMEHNGHIVTGMNNQIVWGMPHVFAVFLIVAASGALNVASIASVFDRKVYKPLARLSGLLAIALLCGGLAVLVLDLGRPDRLVVAMTAYNFKSIFAWNIFLYSGLLAIVAVYLWTMMERKMNRFTTPVGYVAFIWRLLLTTGTGSIFGFLVARPAFDAAVMAPMFVIMSFSFGLAVFLLVLLAAYAWTGRALGSLIIKRLKNLLGIFVAAVLYFVLVYHLANLYATEHHGVEAFVLLHGGNITHVFWFWQVMIGGVVPLALLFSPWTGEDRKWITLAAVLVVIGGFAQMYVIIVGGQAYPMEVFPGKEIIESSFFDGRITQYAATLPEVLLGLGGVAMAMLMVVIGVKVLRFLPRSITDQDILELEVPPRVADSA